MDFNFLSACGTCLLNILVSVGKYSQGNWTVLSYNGNPGYLTEYARKLSGGISHSLMTSFLDQNSSGCSKKGALSVQQASGLKFAAHRNGSVAQLWAEWCLTTEGDI